MITATQVGRNLHITVEGVEHPFVVRPLPGFAGQQITETYLNGALNLAGAAEIADAMMMAVDGARLDEATGRWVPLAADDQTTYRRIGEELSQKESEAVITPAFFWQTILGIDGVNAYLSGGEGIAGTVKALGALRQRLALFAPRTSPSSASDAQTSAASTPSTSTRPGGAKPAKRPQDRRPKKT